MNPRRQARRVMEPPIENAISNGLRCTRYAEL
jgi:hypothetical protein